MTKILLCLAAALLVAGCYSEQTIYTEAVYITPADPPPPPDPTPIIDVPTYPTNTTPPTHDKIRTIGSTRQETGNAAAGSGQQTRDSGSHRRQ